MDTVKINKNNTALIAHRGLSGIECENTAAAFVAAGNRSYFGIETDVHKTADGKFIIIHDDNTGRVCAENLPVENSNYDVEKILDIVKNEYETDKLIFISFDYNNLVYIKELDNTATVQFLCGCPVDDALIEKLLKYGMDLDIYFSYLDEGAIKRLHDNGIKINCWTVDGKCDAERLTEWGIDYITSNILE